MTDAPVPVAGSRTAAVGADPAARGRFARSPRAMPWRGWFDVGKRLWAGTSRNNLALVAAGVAFYAFLAIVPLLGAMVLSYGLAATPATVVANIEALTQVMPDDAARLIGEQLLALVAKSQESKGLGLAIAIGLAIFGAMRGAAAIVTALNISYGEEEKRGYFRLQLIALAITVAAVLMGVLAIVATAALATVHAALPGLSSFDVAIGRLGTYLILAASSAGAALLLYRFGPSRAPARWRWLVPGALLATGLGMAVTLGFGVYAANFGNYNATYGSLSAVVVLQMFLFLNAYALLLGGELNAELERQTFHDTTTGPPRPLGERAADAADTVAGVTDRAA